MNRDISPRQSRPSREVARRGQGIIEEVTLAGWAADGCHALASHIMESVVQVDEYRRILARRCGPEMNKVLLEFEVAGFEQMAAIQRNLPKKWRY